MYVTEVTASSPLAASELMTVYNLSIIAGQVAGKYLTGSMLAPIADIDAASTHIGWFNVKDDFDAAGNGSTDDTSAIQDAIDAANSAIVAGVYRCGVILFPPGNYLVSGSLTAESTTGGGLVFLGAGGGTSSTRGSTITATFNGDLFVVNVTGGGGGVTFRDLHIARSSGDFTPSSGAAFNFEAVINACVTNVFLEGAFDVMQLSQAGESAVSDVCVYGNEFSGTVNRLFTWVGGGYNFHVWDNFIGGLPVAHAAGTNYLGDFDFTADDKCSQITLSNNDIEGFAGGVYFNNTTGSLSDFWIQSNAFDIGDNATKPCFQASASGDAMVEDGHIDDNWMAIGNGLQDTPNAIHLDAGGAASSRVAGIHISGNVFEGGRADTDYTNGAAIYIANGAADLTIVGGRANFQVNAIFVTGYAGTTDGIMISGFGANSPVNGYNSPPGTGNACGIVIQPFGLTSPAAPDLTGPSSGGGLSAGVYKVSVTYVNEAGDETLNSGDTSITVIGSTPEKFSVTSPAAESGAAGYNVYVSTPGGATSTETRQNTDPVSIGTAFTVSSLIGGSDRPSANAALMTVRNLAITGCNLMDCTSNGLLIDPSGGGVISDVSVVANSLWGYSDSSEAVGTAGSPINVNISENPGYNPVGYNSTSAPSIGFGPIENPFGQAARLMIVSTSVTEVKITSAFGGSAIATGLVPTANGVMVNLGVGESVSLSGTIGSSTWKWFLK